MLLLVNRYEASLTKVGKSDLWDRKTTKSGPGCDPRFANCQRESARGEAGPALPTISPHMTPHTWKSPPITIGSSWRSI